MKEMIHYLRVFAAQNMIPAKTVNLIAILMFSYVLLSNIWQMGRKIDQSLSYLEEIPHLRAEIASLKNEKNATQDSLRLFRLEMGHYFKQFAMSMEQMDDRISHTNYSVKNEFKKMNDYFILLSSSNDEIKRMLILKRDNDNILFEQLFPSRYAIRSKP